MTESESAAIERLSSEVAHLRDALDSLITWLSQAAPDILTPSDAALLKERIDEAS